MGLPHRGKLIFILAFSFFITSTNLSQSPSEKLGPHASCRFCWVSERSLNMCKRSRSYWLKSGQECRPALLFEMSSENWFRKRSATFCRYYVHCGVIFKNVLANRLHDLRNSTKVLWSSWNSFSTSWPGLITYRTMNSWSCTVVRQDCRRQCTSGKCIWRPHQKSGYDESIDRECRSECDWKDNTSSLHKTLSLKRPLMHSVETEIAILWTL